MNGAAVMNGKFATLVNGTGRVCTQCLLFKPWKDFRVARGHVTGHSAGCKSCLNKTQGNRRPYHWRRNYGIAPHEIESLLAACDARCSICSVEFDLNSSRPFAIDHCHASLRIRGLLCFKCNQAIGLFSDDVRLLERAKIYLQKSI